MIVDKARTASRRVGSHLILLAAQLCAVVGPRMNVSSHHSTGTCSGRSARQGVAPRQQQEKEGKLDHFNYFFLKGCLR
eukprot:scaffold25235_cov45-Prasinocladus_malaysianus.AAC.1